MYHSSCLYIISTITSFFPEKSAIFLFEPEEAAKLLHTHNFPCNEISEIFDKKVYTGCIFLEIASVFLSCR